MILPFADPPSADEKFYVRALGILVGPSRRISIFMRVVNTAYWCVIILALAFIFSQIIDRGLPIVDRSQTLVEQIIHPGESVKVRYGLIRSKVCATDVSWAEIDGAGEVHHFGPQHIPVPGRIGVDSFLYSWPTSPAAAPGPSRLTVTLEFRCPGNYLQSVFPIVETLPDLFYTVAPADSPHDASGPPASPP